MKYKCLKENWMPYQKAFEEYIKKGDSRRFINKVPDEYKERIGRIWFVNSIWFKIYMEDKIKTIDNSR